jgi:hypothetical protein
MLADQTCSTSEICAILGLGSNITLGKLEKSGWIKRVGKNEWPLSATVQGYVKSVRESRHATASAATAELRKAQLEKLKLANEREAGLSMPVAESLAIFSEVFGALKAALDGLPARCSRDLELRQKIQGELNDVLTRAADHFEKLAAGGDAKPRKAKAK